MSLASIVQPAAGDQMPVCFGMSDEGTFYSSEEQYGRSAVVVLVGDRSGMAALQIERELAPHLTEFAARNSDVLLLVGRNPAAIRGTTAGLIRTIDCGRFISSCGLVPDDILVMVVDRNQRVALTLRPECQTDMVHTCLAALDALPAERPGEVIVPAPVIVLPNLISLELCRYLIDLFERSPTTEGMVARENTDGTSRNVVDHEKKHRRDLLIDSGMALHDTLREILLRRCRPSIAKAFQIRLGHTDRILIARYDETAGHFLRHRDNGAENVAFRQIALSVNLNSGDYDGGHLLFPEYNDHRYRPPAGAGVLFSTAVLHEATQVTRGRRYVLLTFLHDDNAEASRQAYLAGSLAAHA